MGNKNIKAEISALDICIPQDKFIEFCKKALDFKIFNGLEINEMADHITLKVPENNNALSIYLADDPIQLDESSFNPNFPDQIYLFFEGLASVFSGTFAVAYIEDEEKKCKVSIVDGMYTRCGERCLVKNVSFPRVS